MVNSLKVLQLLSYFLLIVFISCQMISDGFRNIAHLCDVFKPNNYHGKHLSFYQNLVLRNYASNRCHFLQSQSLPQFFDYCLSLDGCSAINWLNRFLYQYFCHAATSWPLGHSTIRAHHFTFYKTCGKIIHSKS
jgi:hypothetical protein